MIKKKAKNKANYSKKKKIQNKKKFKTQKYQPFNEKNRKFGIRFKQYYR